MKNQKFSLSDIEGKLTRQQMRNILGGSGPGELGGKPAKSCRTTADCSSGETCCKLASGEKKCLRIEDC